ncbi:MAG: bifunctional diaminohydroxyphosphoribosylaminopyrimidine deaminase/5-amino-6-(5-phosphoribosylamino)uracil reductase RibD [Planctomycetaceae bacterium]|nr:bifunctional diaminohydroxyphosphoribosylaminopyrimidine deaminase/5-amino-6-(5-phosphoribosylamino)uracil reductase RibD [Planctomycetaceae bacterium]
MTQENANPEHEQYMRLALDLARRGIGAVEPNPAVGCVVVQSNQIIGKGWHERFGGPHAEINAISDCWKHGYNPAGSTLYLTLEPCTHYGKTPPCTESVVLAGICKVVFASHDPYEISGGGGELLQQAGLDIVSGVCRGEAEELNAAFFKHGRTGLPWVTLKWAQSIDGKMAWKEPPAEGDWISNEQSRRDVHRLRKRAQGILTGVDTVLHDNPLLTARIERERIERPALRVILDSRLRIPLDRRVVAAHDAPTMVVTTEAGIRAEPLKAQQLTAVGVEIVAVGEKEHRCDLMETLAMLGKRGIQRLLVEAGPTLVTEFLHQNLADEVHIYIAPVFLGSAGTADLSAQMTALPKCRMLKNVTSENFGNDICISGKLLFASDRA